MRRQKRKPDEIELNFVQSNPKRKSISVKKVSYPFAEPSEERLEARSSTVSTQPTWAPTITASRTVHFWGWVMLRYRTNVILSLKSVAPWELIL